MRAFLSIIIIVFITSCSSHEQRYYGESPEIEYSKALLAYYSSFNFRGIKSIYNDSVKIYENNVVPYDIERLLASIKSAEAYIDYQRLEDSLKIEMVVNDKKETWVNAQFLWVIKYKNSSKEIKIPVYTSWRYIDDKIVTEYTYYDSRYFDQRFDSIPIK